MRADQPRARLDEQVTTPRRVLTPPEPRPGAARAGAGGPPTCLPPPSPPPFVQAVGPSDVGAFSWPLPNTGKCVFFLDTTNSLFIAEFKRPQVGEGRLQGSACWALQVLRLWAGRDAATALHRPATSCTTRRPAHACSTAAPSCLPPSPLPPPPPASPPPRWQTFGTCNSARRTGCRRAARSLTTTLRRASQRAPATCRTMCRRGDGGGAGWGGVVGGNGTGLAPACARGLLAVDPATPCHPGSRSLARFFGNLNRHPPTTILNRLPPRPPNRPAEPHGPAAAAARCAACHAARACRGSPLRRACHR